MEDSIYPGEATSRALENQALPPGFGPYVTTVKDVWPSLRRSFNSIRTLSTTIITNTFHEATLSAKVTITGFGTGSDPSSPFAVLNGEHRTYTGNGNYAIITRDRAKVYTPNHYEPADDLYNFDIPVDTSAIRASCRCYNPAVDGVATVTVEFAPITEDLIPADYYATASKWLSFNVFDVHTVFRGFSKLDGTPFDTFDEMQAAVAIGATNVAFYNTRRLNGGGTSFYAAGRDGATLLNDKLAAPDNFNGYNIPAENYLSEAFWVYWAIDPNTTSSPDDITGNLVGQGYNANGSRFMFTYAPRGSTPTYPYPGAPQAANGTNWALLTNRLDRARRNCPERFYF